jgi:hypothetical protein
LFCFENHFLNNQVSKCSFQTLNVFLASCHVSLTRTMLPY